MQATPHSTVPFTDPTKRCRPYLVPMGPHTHRTMRKRRSTERVRRLEPNPHTLTNRMLTGWFQCLLFLSFTGGVWWCHHKWTASAVAAKHGHYSAISPFELQLNDYTVWLNLVEAIMCVCVCVYFVLRYSIMSVCWFWFRLMGVCS